MKQELFNRAVGGVLAQGGPSTQENNSDCMYRGPDGRKCAVGHLISDEHYNPMYEGYDSVADEVEEMVENSNPHLALDQDDFEGMEALQMAHDQCAKNPSEFIPNFLNRARHLATRFNLKWEFEPAP